MAIRIFHTVGFARLLASMTFLTALTGCFVGGSGGYRGHVQTTVSFEDDYDYYPSYETYYSRNRHEYVYLIDNVWVRRPEPRGVSVSVFLAAPSVRLDFRDAPENHHRTVIQSYPRTWRGPEANREVRPGPPAIRTEQREAKPEPTQKERNTARDVRPANRQKQPDAKAKHPNNQRDKPKDDLQDNQQDDRKDDRKDDHKGQH